MLVEVKFKDLLGGEFDAFGIFFASNMLKMRTPRTRGVRAQFARITSGRGACSKR